MALRLGDLTFDAASRQLRRGAQEIHLSPKAFDLLLYFAEHPEETLSRERLIADVWGGKFVTAVPHLQVGP